MIWLVLYNADIATGCLPVITFSANITNGGTKIKILSASILPNKMSKSFKIQLRKRLRLVSVRKLNNSLME